MKLHQLSADDALRSLRTGPDGLTAAEAARRLAEFGPNRVEPLRRTPLVIHFFQGMTHFFALILWLAAGLAFAAAWADPAAGMGALGGAIVGVIVVNAVFSFWQEFKAERAFAVLERLLPRTAKVVRDGRTRFVPAEDLVPGDVVLLDGGNEVPADCRLIRAFGVRVNTATVTGESVPQARDERPCDADEVVHGRNVLLAGTAVVAGKARGVVFATGRHTEFGKIARLSQAVRDNLSPLQREVVRLSRMIAALAMGLGLVFFVAGLGLGVPAWSGGLFAIGIIVANVPEGLLPTLTLSLAMAAQRMARRNALVRHLPAVEALGAATVICTDKTGTLTENRMAVRRLVLAGREYEIADCDLAGLRDHHPELFEAAARCQTLEAVAGGGTAGDPLEVALVELARSAGCAPAGSPPVDEVPFDSDRRRLSTLHRTPAGLTLYTKGALEALLPLCRQVRTSRGVVPLTDREAKAMLVWQDRMAANGLRVLAFADRIVPEGYDRDRLEEGLTLRGLVGLEDPPRPEVPAAVRSCREAGIRVIMVTGDHPHTALAVARQVGLVGPGGTAITGGEVRRMSDIQLQLALDHEEVVFARVAADQKARIVAALQAKGHVVAVTGDGVNDAPALRRADVGVAMGLTGTDVARAAADIVLADDNFASIVAAVEEGRAVFANVRKFLTYILTSNVPELVPYLAFALFKVPLALPVIQILAVDLGTDLVPALALGAEPPDPDAMRRPPRPRTERLLTWPVLARAYLWLGAFEAAAGMAAFFAVLCGGGWTFGRLLADDSLLYRQATTACLGAVVLMQVVNLFLCRGDRTAAFAGAFANRLIPVGIAVEVAFFVAIGYTAAGNALFGTAPVPPIAWAAAAPFAGGMLALEELRKWWVRCHGS